MWRQDADEAEPTTVDAIIIDALDTPQSKPNTKYTTNNALHEPTKQVDRRCRRGYRRLCWRRGVLSRRLENK